VSNANRCVLGAVSWGVVWSVLVFARTCASIGLCAFGASEQQMDLSNHIRPQVNANAMQSPLLPRTRYPQEAAPHAGGSHPACLEAQRRSSSAAAACCGSSLWSQHSRPATAINHHPASSPEPVPDDAGNAPKTINEALNNAAEAAATQW